MEKLNYDAFGNKIQLPNIGDAVFQDGYEFKVSEVIPHNDINIVASITLRGESGMYETGYYDYLKHPKKRKTIYVLPT